MKTLLITTVLTFGIVGFALGQNEDLTIYTKDNTVIFSDELIRNSVSDESPNYVISSVIDHTGPSDEYLAEVKYKTEDNTIHSLFLFRSTENSRSMDHIEENCSMWKLTSAGDSCCKLVIREGNEVTTICEEQPSNMDCPMVVTCLEK